jgi:hypothetical protein
MASGGADDIKEVANMVRSLLLVIKPYYSESEYEFIYSNTRDAYFSQLKYLINTGNSKDILRVKMINLMNVANKTIVQHLPQPDVGIIIFGEYFEAMINYIDALWIDNPTTVKITQTQLVSQVKRLSRYLAVQYKILYPRTSSIKNKGSGNSEKFINDLIMAYQSLTKAFIAPHQTAEDAGLVIYAAIIEISDVIDDYSPKWVSLVQKINVGLAKMYFAISQKESADKIISETTDHKNENQTQTDIAIKYENGKQYNSDALVYKFDTRNLFNKLTSPTSVENLINHYKAYGFYIDQMTKSYQLTHTNAFNSYTTMSKSQAALLAGALASKIISE